MPIYRIEVYTRDPRTREQETADLLKSLRAAGLSALRRVTASRIFLVEADEPRARTEAVAGEFLADPVSEQAHVLDREPPTDVAADRFAIEVHPRPGVMNPVALSTHAELRRMRFDAASVRTARRFVFEGLPADRAAVGLISAFVANDCIEELVVDAVVMRAAPVPPTGANDRREIPIRGLDDRALERRSRDGHLFLSLVEMRAIQQHFRTLERDPTDLELETIAQTWSEHCVHKTFKSEVTYRGPGFGPDPAPAVEVRYENLLKDTIARATREIRASGRGPECLSVFVDNAGVIGLDDEFGIAVKVETHNHPSAIEPYGGAATGVGGCIRDVMGCGLGARPIANTDVFCVAPGDWPLEELPRGVLHPDRVLRGVARGVADYGNRMGIPTVNGAVHFDPRYIGNPLVFCGCVGLMPRSAMEKAARPGDRIVVLGGRTGRDGIHGATFSSAELTDAHADEFSHAVQIGNAITEKRCLDGLLAARDAADGPLYHAVTDCGAGGLSSAVGEMAAEIGASVQLDRVLLKYAGLRYDEIWISEAQERMVVAVPPEKLDRFLAIVTAEEVEAVDIGRFGCSAAGRPVLRVHYGEGLVGELDLEFLHEGVPRIRREATWSPGVPLAPPPALPDSWTTALLARLAAPTVAAKEWIVRAYDHEVQGGSAIKPFMGPGNGPTDAAVIRPRLGSPRAIAIGNGLAPQLFDHDPYWMAAAAIDEALRNVVCVGADPRRAAILDNFCWGRADDPQQLGGLVRASQACYDLAVAYGTPFISGKDSLNNEFALDPADVERVLARVRSYVDADALSPLERDALFEAIAERVRRTGRLSIPGTLLVSAVALIDDVQRCVSSDLKPDGGDVYLVGGLPLTDFDAHAAARVHAAVADAIAAGAVRACHDVSEGGWLVSLAEMAIAGRRGVRIVADADAAPLAPRTAGYVIQSSREDALAAALAGAGISMTRIAAPSASPALELNGRSVSLADLDRAWRGTGRRS